MKHGDVLSTVDAAGPNAGKIAHKYTYDAFGNESGIDANDQNPFRYCGEWWDKQTKRLYLRARDYDATTGRFTSEDPIKDGLNWYTYCENNPINAIDPWGLKSYIFYISEWEDSAREDKKMLIELGIPEDEIIMVPINSADDLKNGWNAMGVEIDKKTGKHKAFEIDYVIINTHGSPERLGDLDSKGNFKWSLTVDEINRFGEKKINKMLILTGCNVGHFDYKNTNPAAAFAKRVMNAPVIAADGGVSMHKIDGYHRTNGDWDFLKYQSETNPDFIRNSLGWIQYQYNGRYITTISLNTIYLSIASISHGPMPYLNSNHFKNDWFGSPYYRY